MMKVCVIGDVIIDRYIYGTARRISPEAPVPVINYLNTVDKFGGARLVYENLLSLGSSCDILEFNHQHSIKTRIICDGHYVTRIDNDTIVSGDEVLDQILKQDFSEYAFCILSDYNKGVLTHSKEIIEHINSFGCRVIVDPKKHYSHYDNAWLIKPNSAEFVDFEFDSCKGNKVITGHNTNMAVIDNTEYYSYVSSVEVNDVTGAGDCFLAAFVYGLTREYDYQRCLDIATKAATESVKHMGTYILKPGDVEECIVFTNGCFDIIHRGHLEYLRQSKELGTKLIVGLNSDASVRRLKGETRPINTEADRKAVLEALEFVDEVIIFDEDTPYELIKSINPYIITKGGDYTPKAVVGNDISRVVIIPFLGNYSSSNIVEQLNDKT